MTDAAIDEEEESAELILETEIIVKLPVLIHWSQLEEPKRPNLRAEMLDGFTMTVKNFGCSMRKIL